MISHTAHKFHVNKNKKIILFGVLQTKHSIFNRFTGVFILNANPHVTKVNPPFWLLPVWSHDNFTITWSENTELLFRHWQRLDSVRTDNSVEIGGYSVQESLSNHVKLPVYCIVGTMFKNHCPNMFVIVISCFEIMIIVMFHYSMVAWELEIYIFKFTFLYLISKQIKL